MGPNTNTFTYIADQICEQVPTMRHQIITTDDNQFTISLAVRDSDGRWLKRSITTNLTIDDWFDVADPILHLADQLAAATGKPSPGLLAAGFDNI